MPPPFLEIGDIGIVIHYDSDGYLVDFDKAIDTITTHECWMFSSEVEPLYNLNYSPAAITNIPGAH